MPLLLTLSGALWAQSPYVPPCPSAALDATFQAVDGPDHSYTLAINLRNISVETCFVDTDPQGGVVIAGRPEVRLPFGICHYCERGSQRPSVTEINLALGESVHQTRSWRTAPVDPAKKCVSPTRMSWAVRYNLHSYFWLFSPSLLRPICSQFGDDITCG